MPEKTAGLHDESLKGSLSHNVKPLVRLHPSPGARRDQEKSSQARRAADRYFEADRDKADLVQLCVDNFGWMAEGRERFFREMADFYAVLHPEYDVPNVEQCLAEWKTIRMAQTKAQEKEATDRMEQRIGASPDELAGMRWSIAMDKWIEMSERAERKAIKKTARQRRRDEQNRPSRGQLKRASDERPWGAGEGSTPKKQCL